MQKELTLIKNEIKIKFNSVCPSYRSKLESAVAHTDEISVSSPS
jgi:hypothetical protein